MIKDFVGMLIMTGGVTLVNVACFKLHPVAGMICLGVTLTFIGYRIVVID